ncbi:MAG: GNAT family N-acetyltransferase [Candidatus Micrarchaeia archaeon]
MRIRKYMKTMVGAVSPLLSEATQGWEEEWRQEIFNLYSRYSRTLGEAYVAEDKGEIIGTIFLKRCVRALVIYFLAVSKKRRGEGIGKALVRMAERIAAREKRILRVDVENKCSNERFYEKLGFRKCGRVENFYMEGDDQIFMWKKPAGR